MTLPRKGERFLGFDLTAAALLSVASPSGDRLRVEVGRRIVSVVARVIADFRFQGYLHVVSFAFEFVVGGEGKLERLRDGCGQRARHLTEASTRGTGKIRDTLMSSCLLIRPRTSMA